MCFFELILKLFDLIILSYFNKVYYRKNYKWGMNAEIWAKNSDFYIKNIVMWERKCKKASLMLKFQY